MKRADPKKLSIRDVEELVERNDIVAYALGLLRDDDVSPVQCLVTAIIWLVEVNETSRQLLLDTKMREGPKVETVLTDEQLERFIESREPKFPKGVS